MAFLHLAEGALGLRVDRGLAGKCLPPTDDGVDVARIELQPVADPAGTLGRNHGRATTEEWVQNEVIAGGAVHDRVRDHGNRFHRGMEAGARLLTVAVKGAHARILPDVRAVAS